MDDLISRKAAVEIIQSMYPGMPRVPWRTKNWEKQYEPYIRVEKEIKRLPSAKPQRMKAERTTPGNLVIGDDGNLVYCPLCGAKYDRG